MPVIYNCSVCRKRLSISRRKIGEKVECPYCSSFTEVPAENQSSLPSIEFQEVDAPRPPKGPRASEPENSSTDPVPAGEGVAEETQVPQESDTPPEARTRSGISAAEREQPIPTPLRDAEIERAAVSLPEQEALLRIRRASSEFEEMDLTPMVDVTFLLLIFFMITASFTLEKTIPTPVPDPNEQSASQPIQQQEELLEKSVLIQIQSDNSIIVDDEPLENATLLGDRLTDIIRREKKAEVLVTVADVAMQERVVYVLDTANDVGMQKIRLAAETGDSD